jgi:hypothetical protein
MWFPSMNSHLLLHSNCLRAGCHKLIRQITGCRESQAQYDDPQHSDLQAVMQTTCLTGEEISFVALILNVWMAVLI